MLVEDKHAIGDQDLLDNEASKGENNSNITAFVILFVIISAASVVCCYLNYLFPAPLALVVFYIFLGAMACDLLCFRILLVFGISALQYLRSKRRGYGRVEYRSYREVRELTREAVRTMGE